jgi:hypothetical protein
MKTSGWIIVLLGAMLLSSCADIAYWQLETFYKLDCRPEHLKNGQCVPIKKGGNDVTTAQP